MSLILASKLEAKNFIKYQGRLHIIKSITKYDNYTEIVLRGIYLPHTLVNLIEGPDSYLELATPDCDTYIVNRWFNGDRFELIRKNNSSEKIIMHISDKVDKITLTMQTSHNPVYVEMCKDNTVYGIYSIHK